MSSDTFSFASMLMEARKRIGRDNSRQASHGHESAFYKEKGKRAGGAVTCRWTG